MSGSPLKQLGALGQSVWLDYLRRDLMASGELRRLIEENGLRGMTWNPSIFEKAIADSHDYDEDIRALALKGEGVEKFNRPFDKLMQTQAQRSPRSLTGDP